MLRKGLGIFVYFLFVGLWFIVAGLLLFAAIPWMLLVFFAGYMSNARPWPELKHWTLWMWVRKYYFRFKPCGNASAHTNTHVLYAVFPHGHYSMTHLFYFTLNPKFADLRPAIHGFLFYVPFFATLARWVSAVSVERGELLEALQQGPIIMCPAGIRDMTNEGTQTDRRHQGFLSVAAEANVKVVPVWCPQERSYYTHYLPFGRVLERFFYLPFPVIILGRWWCPIIPRAPLADSEVRFGAPMDPNNQEEFWAALEGLKN